MITRRTATLLTAAAPAAFSQERTSTALISDPEGPHLSMYLEGFRVEAVGDVAIADATGGIFDRARRTLPGREVRTFRDAAEMLRTVRPQLALVALEARRSPDAIRLALEHDCHVLAEKPACVRWQDFAALADLAAKRKRHLMLAFATRLNPAAMRARELVMGGSIGRLFGFTAHYIADQTRLTRPDYQKSWFASRERAGGGHLAWLGIHYIDLIQFVTGQAIVQVAAQTANVGGQRIEIEDSAAVSLQLQDGALGTLQSAYYLDRGYHTGLSVWGSEGWMRFDPTMNRIEWYRNGSEPCVETPLKVDAYPELVRAAAEAARGAREPLVTGRECVAALQTVFTSYESARTGRILRIT